MKYLPLLFLVLAGCGKSFVKVLTINSDLQPYYQDFINDGLSRGVDLTKTDNLILEFGDLPPHRLGVCTIGFVNSNMVTPEVTIDRKYWAISSELDKQTVIHHELAHCLLRKGHNDSVNADGYPVSIMNTYSVSEEFPIYLYEHWDEYLDELYR